MRQIGTRLFQKKHSEGCEVTVRLVLKHLVVSDHPRVLTFSDVFFFHRIGGVLQELPLILSLQRFLSFVLIS